MEAIATYLYELRKGQKLSRAKLAAALNTTENTIWRIERKQQEPTGVLLLSLLQSLQGSWGHIQQLLAPGVTEDEGRRLAREWLTYTPEQRKQAERIGQNIAFVVTAGMHDPAKFQRVIAQLRQDADADPAILDLIEGILIGRRQLNQS